MYNKKENLPALRRTVCCLLLTSMLLAALLALPCLPARRAAMTRPGAPCA